jgi:hypothetical protein
MNIENASMLSFINKLFEARQQTHVLHLQTSSYAQHKALESFYDGILGLADQFVETYSGEFGIVSSFSDIKVQNSIDPIAYLEGFIKILKDFPIICQESHLRNLVDEMTSLTYQTIYKLKYLK